MAIDLKTTKPGIKDVDPYLLVNIGIGVSSLVLILLSFILLISPTLTKYKTVKEEISKEISITPDKIDALRKDKGELEKKKEDVFNNLKKLKDDLAVNKDISHLLDRFIYTAKRRRLEFTYIKPLKSQVKVIDQNQTMGLPATTQPNQQPITVSVLEIPIEIKLEAGYLDFVGFLKEIESLEKTLNINSLRIINNPKNPIKHNVEINMSIYQLLSK